MTTLPISRHRAGGGNHRANCATRDPAKTASLWSFVLGIVSVILMIAAIGGIIGIVALVCGVYGAVVAAENHYRAYAIAGIALGTVSVGLLSLIMIVATVGAVIG